ncbi:MAG: hypothetical protein LQ345_001316 [Seirophora villosa]|nr:MAG: hypothetical protein LQ345_001316 [Seirophora villosa]
MSQPPSSLPPDEESDLWLFGYGSLIWKPPPHYVWGAAYRIPAPHVPAVQTYLDIREINGYSIQYTSFTPAADAATTTLLHHPGPIEKCMVYIGLPENPQFLGAQPAADVAAVIARSKGPSGENVEYLFMLERALRELGDAAGDEHVEDLARRVREIKGRDHGGGDDGLGDGGGGRGG